MPAPYEKPQRSSLRVFSTDPVRSGEVTMAPPNSETSYAAAELRRRQESTRRLLQRANQHF